MPKNPNRVAAGKRVATHSIPKTCPAPCGIAFLGTGKQIYCSRACKEAAQKARRTAARCGHCGTEIDARKGQRYCSDTCRHRGRYAPAARPCAVCRIAFTPPRRQGKRILCSRECKTVADSAAKLARRIGTPQQQAAALVTELESRNANSANQT